jgi:hypothetical protein
MPRILRHCNVYNNSMGIIIELPDDSEHGTDALCHMAEDSGIRYGTHVRLYLSSLHANIITPETYIPHTALVHSPSRSQML